MKNTNFNYTLLEKEEGSEHIALQTVLYNFSSLSLRPSVLDKFLSLVSGILDKKGISLRIANKINKNHLLSTYCHWVETPE